MKRLRFAILVLVFMLLQGGNLLNMFAFTNLNIKPDLLVVLLVFCAVNCSIYEAIIISFALGFAADVIAFPVGPRIISFGLIGMLLCHIRGIIMIKKMTHQALVIFITVLLTGLITSLLIVFKGYPTVPNAVYVLLGTALYTALIGPYLCWLLSALSGWLGIRKHRVARNRNR